MWITCSVGSYSTVGLPPRSAFYNFQGLAHIIKCVKIKYFRARSCSAAETSLEAGTYLDWGVSSRTPIRRWCVKDTRADLVTVRVDAELRYQDYWISRLLIEYLSSNLRNWRT